MVNTFNTVETSQTARAGTLEANRYALPSMISDLPGGAQGPDMDLNQEVNELDMAMIENEDENGKFDPNQNVSDSGVDSTSLAAIYIEQGQASKHHQSSKQRKSPDRLKVQKVQVASKAQKPNGQLSHKKNMRQG